MWELDLETFYQLIDVLKHKMTEQWKNEIAKFTIEVLICTKKH